jgi:hypothetical protein
MVGGGPDSWEGAMPDGAAVGCPAAGSPVVGWPVAGVDAGDFGEWDAVAPGLAFEAVGAAPPDAGAVEVGMAAVVTPLAGELAAVDVTLQPAAITVMREAPSMRRAALRPLRLSQILILPLSLRNGPWEERLVNRRVNDWQFGFVR